MKDQFNKINFIVFYLGLIFISGCIEDDITPPLKGDLNSTAEMLVYLESLGDFPNSFEAPALIDAEEVYLNLNSYLIVDIRPNEEFIAGHIGNSVNVAYDSLFNFIEKNFNSGYPKIIIVSKNGQSSAYFTCLLRLAGFNNVYTMGFGLASWNEFFADEWLGALGNDPEIIYYNDEDNPKNDFATLPGVIFDNPSASIKEQVNGRIKKIISEGFQQDVHYRRYLVVFANDYLVCYGNTSRLYFARRNGPLAELGHHERAIFYKANPIYELRSTEFLQTLPNNSEVFIYDGTGELSACITAYLRLLGYNAKTLLFGANQLFYDRMIDDPDLMNFVFSYSRIKNYPYIAGKQ